MRWVQSWISKVSPSAKFTDLKQISDGILLPYLAEVPLFSIISPIQTYFFIMLFSPTKLLRRSRIMYSLGSHWCKTWWCPHPIKCTWNHGELRKSSTSHIRSLQSHPSEHPHSLFAFPHILFYPVDSVSNNELVTYPILCSVNVREHESTTGPDLGHDLCDSSRANQMERSQGPICSASMGPG